MICTVAPSAVRTAGLLHQSAETAEPLHRLSGNYPNRSIGLENKNLNLRGT